MAYVDKLVPEVFEVSYLSCKFNYYPIILLSISLPLLTLLRILLQLLFHFTVQS